MDRAAAGGARHRPAYVNQLIGLLKGTSIIFYVSLLDLFGEVESLQSTYPGGISILLLAATVWYVTRPVCRSPTPDRSSNGAAAAGSAQPRCPVRRMPVIVVRS